MRHLLFPLWKVILISITTITRYTLEKQHIALADVVKVATGSTFFNLALLLPSVFTVGLNIALLIILFFQILYILLFQSAACISFIILLSSCTVIKHDKLLSSGFIDQ